MYRKVASISLLGVVFASIFSATTQAETKPKINANTPAVLTVIHAIPISFGADKVDVYSNNKLVLDNATPGSVKTFSLSRGMQEVSIYPDGVVPASGVNALLKYRAVYLAAGANVTMVAHLDSAEKPTLSLFKNMITDPGNKRSWLTVRHVAAAPAVDVRGNGKTLFKSLVSTKQRKVTLRAGTYPVDVVLAGTTTVAIPSANVVIKDNVNTIVYAWGAASKNNLQFYVQEVPVR